MTCGFLCCDESYEKVRLSRRTFLFALVLGMAYAAKGPDGIVGPILHVFYSREASV